MSIPKSSIKIKGIERVLLGGIVLSLMAAVAGGIVLRGLFSAQKPASVAQSRLYTPLVAPGSMAPPFTIIASKTGKKYYASTCGSAKRIKPENIVTFKDREEAERRGYTAAANCSDLEITENSRNSQGKIE